MYLPQWLQGKWRPQLEGQSSLCCEAGLAWLGLLFSSLPQNRCVSGPITGEPTCREMGMLMNGWMSEWKKEQAAAWQTSRAADLKLADLRASLLGRANLLGSPWSPHWWLFLQGRSCEVSLDGCSSNPCGNGGTCHAQEGEDAGFT